MDLYSILKRRASENPAKTAIISETKSLSYLELLRLTRVFSQYLYYAKHVRRGDRVGILLPNTPEFVAAYFAVLKLGGVVVPFKTLITREELSCLVADSGTEVLITSRYFEKIVNDIEEPGSGLKVIYLEDLKAKARGLGFFNILPHVERLAGTDDTAVIIYTSGTTGKPKGAMLTHGNIVSNVVSSSMVFNAGSDDRFLAVLPMFHVFGMTGGVLMPIYAGGTVISLREFKPLATIKAVEEHGATVFLGVPFMYGLMANVKGKEASLRSLKVCISGGAALPLEVLRAFENKFGVPIYEGIGLSETAPIIAVNPIGKRKVGSVGKAIPGVEIKVVDDLGRELSRGKKGEVIVRGPNVMKGYLNKDEETKKAIKNGWFYTGDIGIMDEEGYIFIVDRKKEMITVRGLKVYPREIEEVIHRHPSVREAAVVGVKDSLSGELPKAVIVPKDDSRITKEEIVAFCRERLASFKVPKIIEFVEELPKTASGKILKRVLAGEAEPALS